MSTAPRITAHIHGNHAASLTKHQTYLRFHFKLLCATPELSRLRDELRCNRPSGFESFTHVPMADCYRLDIFVYLCVAQGEEGVVNVTRELLSGLPCLPS